MCPRHRTPNTHDTGLYLTSAFSPGGPLLVRPLPLLLLLRDAEHMTSRMQACSANIEPRRPRRLCTHTSQMRPMHFLLPRLPVLSTTVFTVLQPLPGLLCPHPRAPAACAPPPAPPPSPGPPPDWPRTRHPAPPPAAGRAPAGRGAGQCFGGRQGNGFWLVTSTRASTLATGANPSHSAKSVAADAKYTRASTTCRVGATPPHTPLLPNVQCSYAAQRALD